MPTDISVKPADTSVQTAAVELKSDKRFKFFRRFISAPYLLAIFALFLPIMNVSCADKVIAEPSLYEIATGLDLHESLQEPAKGYLLKMEKDHPESLDKFRESLPGFPQLNPTPHLFIIVGALFLAGAFAWFTALGSIAMGMLSMVSLWAFLGQASRLCGNVGIKVLEVEPSYGIYAASALILIGTAMNLAVIVRPILLEFKAKHPPKKAEEPGK